MSVGGGGRVSDTFSAISGIPRWQFQGVLPPPDGKFVILGFPDDSFRVFYPPPDGIIVTLGSPDDSFRVFYPPQMGNLAFWDPQMTVSGCFSPPPRRDFCHSGIPR